MKHCMLLLVVSVIAVFHGTHSTHFIGGTLSWRYEGSGRNIILVYFLNTYGSDTGIDGGTGFELYVDGSVLQEGNNPTVILKQAAKSESLTWTANKGSNPITNTEVGLDRISYFGVIGVELYDTTSNSWQLTTYLDLADRPDTGQINNSPVVLGIPFIVAEKGCAYTIRIPVFDPDGDNIKCRLATGTKECGDVCNTRVPGTSLDPTSCTLTFDTNSAVVANYGMMIQVEDYISSTSFTPLSSVPFQFVVEVRETTLNCNSGPVFVSPTPEEGSCIPLKVGEMFTLNITATTTGGATITEIPYIGPTALNGSGSELSSSSRTIQWTPSATDSGLHLLCFQAIDSNSTGSEQRCVNLNVGGVRATVPTSHMGAVRIDHSTWTTTFDAEFQAPSSNQFIKIYDNASVLQEIIDISNGTNFVIGSDNLSATFETTFEIKAETVYTVYLPPTFIFGTGECGKQQLSNWTFIVKDCGLPVPPDNGLVKSETNKTLYESTFTIECNTGYENTPGSDTITCNENGSWTEGATCTKKDCGLPVPPDNGVVKSDTNNTFYESTYTIECNTGYEKTSGSDTITCNENGSWTEGTTCTKKDCGTVPTLTNGARNDTGGTTYGDTATFACNTGYTISGDAAVICQADGIWETLPATCTIKNCGTVPTLTNGARNDTGGTTYGDTATFACNTGYTISGDAAVICKADGTWETLPATCTIKDCGKVTIPINAYILTVNHTAYFRSMVTFQCNTRYLFKSSVRQIECTENGTWTKGPTCIPADAVGLITVMGISAGAVVVLLSVGLTLGVTITIMRKQRLQRFKSRVPAPDYDDIPRPDYDDYDSNPRRDYDDNAFNPSTLFSNGTATVFHN